MVLWFTMVPMLTPITPIVLRCGSHFLKRGVMGLADSVTTFEMQQRPRSMKNSPVFRCPLKTHQLIKIFHTDNKFFFFCGPFDLNISQKILFLVYEKCNNCSLSKLISNIYTIIFELTPSLSPSCVVELFVFA